MHPRNVLNYQTDQLNIVRCLRPTTSKLENCAILCWHLQNGHNCWCLEASKRELSLLIRKWHIRRMLKIANCLLIQLGNIGDIVLTEPTIRAVNEAYPSDRISVLARKPYGSVLDADPNVHELVEAGRYRGNLYRRLSADIALLILLRQKRYDIVTDLRMGDREAVFSCLCGASARNGRRLGGRPPTACYPLARREPRTSSARNAVARTGAEVIALGEGFGGIDFLRSANTEWP